MNGRWVVSAALVLLSGCVSTAKQTAAEETVQAAVYRVVAAETAIADWPPLPAAAARKLIARYGVPSDASDERVVWTGNRPWTRTIVRRRAPVDYDAESSISRDFVEQAVAYPLTARQAAELEKFDRRVTYDRVNRELQARSEREATNFLLLNSAVDVVRGRMSPEQARALYEQTLRLEAAGKTSSSMEVLHFPP